MLTGSWKVWGRRAVVATVVTSMFAVAVRPASADPKADTSLAFVPSDVAFYSTSLKMKETLDTFVASNAFKRLKSMPAVQMGLQEFRNQWNDPTPEMAQFKTVYESPQAQQLLAFLGDMISHEFFVVGDMQHADLAELGAALNAAVQKAQFETGPDGEPDPMAMVRALIDGLDAGRNKIVVPGTVMGFKVADRDRAVAYLGQLDGLITLASLNNPALQGRYVKERVGGTEYMVMKLDGKMVPWQLVGFFVPGLDFQKFNRVVAKLNELKLHIAIGVRGDYVVLSIADSTKLVGSFGKGDMLYDREEFAPLRTRSSKPLVSVGYTSLAYAERAGAGSDADAIKQAFDSMLPQLPIDDELKLMIQGDVAKFAKWAADMVPEPGATASFEFETDRGYETFSYSWAENGMLDGTKTLPILDHVGGKPVAFAVGRGVYDPEQFEALMVGVEKMYGYVEMVMMKELSEGERAEFQRVVKAFKPLAVEMGKVMGEKFVPASKDGQNGFVLDMQAKSKQWFMGMLEADEPLPIPEIAVVGGVSDPALFKEGLEDMYGIIGRFGEKLTEFIPPGGPDFQPFLKPTVSSVDGGTLYVNKLPPMIDGQLAVTNGISDSISVFSTSPALATRVLQSHPLAVEGLLAEAKGRKLAGASHFDFAAFMDGMSPWIDYGFTMYMRAQAVSTEETELVTAQVPPVEAIRDQVHTVVDVLKCFRGVSSVTYIEDGAVVTHSEYVFEDLED